MQSLLFHLIERNPEKYLFLRNNLLDWCKSGKKEKELPLLEKVTITDVAAEGKAIAKVNDLVIFVPYVVPGDVVDLQIKRKKNKYAEAEAVNFHEYSSTRAVPFCQHYGICGGCKWQVLPYAEQIKYKQKQVEDNLRRIGKIELPEISPILGSAKTEFYRNKLEFTFSDKRWLTYEEVKQEVKYDQMNAVGFHIPEHSTRCWLLRNAGYRMIYPTVSVMRYVIMLTSTITPSLICVRKKACFAI